ncbi:MAG: OmpA family protein [Rhodothermales bacterium]
MKKPIYILTLGVSCTILAACGGPPANNPLLKEAQLNYQTAASDPEIVANAPVAMKTAGEALGKSETMFNQGAEENVVTHYAYLANQRTEIAKQNARQQAAENTIEHAKTERQEVLLTAREQDAKLSQRQAEEAKLGMVKAEISAEQAKTEARVAEAEADNAKQGMVEATVSAEQAKAEAVHQTREAEIAKAEAVHQTREAEMAKAEARDALASAQALSERVAELEARKTNRGLVITLSDILFDSGKATLKVGADRALVELTSFLNEYEDRNLLIEGFTDNVGTTEYNQDLSVRRANAVRRALVLKGVADTRIRTDGLGERYPVATNDTGAGRQQNRRVEIVISDESGMIPGRDN